MKKFFVFIVIALLFASVANATWDTIKEPTGNTCQIWVQTFADPTDNQSEYQAFSVVGTEYITNVSNQYSTGFQGIEFVFDEAFTGTLTIKHTVYLASNDPAIDGTTEVYTKVRSVNAQANDSEVFFLSLYWHPSKEIIGVSVETTNESAAVGHFYVYQSSLNHNGSGVECGN